MVAGADGTAPRQVAVGESPKWSPDGTSLVFTRNRQLRVVEVATGSTRTLVSTGAGSPDWSPDGRKIAFADGFFRPATVNADGSELREVPIEGLGEFRFWNIAGIAWSPDGKQFAVSVELEPHTSHDVYVLPVAGGRLHRVTDAGAAVDPAWSPDGRWIAYANDGTYYSSLADSSVAVVRADGSGQHRLPPPETPFGWRTRHPAWRDANTVVFSAWRPYGAYARNVELHAIRLDGTGERRLTYHCQYGSPKADLWLTGTYLDDVIYPRGGNDRVRTGAGRDVVHARAAGRDMIDCGPGADIVFADSRDVVHRDCERVRRR